MRRREFISLLGGAVAAWPLGARAQQPTMPVIGFLNPAFIEANADRLRGFHRGLKDAGYVEGENVAVVYRWAEGQNDRLPELAADLVRRQVSVIASFTPAAAFAVKATTATIPIVFGVNEDPVRLGLVASLARPGGNATGINFLTAEVAAKRLNLLRELVPAAARVSVLVNPANPTSTESTLKDVLTAARAIGLQTQAFNAGTGSEINAAFAALISEKSDALLVAGRSVLQQPTCAIGSPCYALCDSCDLFPARVYRHRWPHELRAKPFGCVPASRRLCRPHPQGRQASGPAGGAVDQVRTGHQRGDRQATRPHCAADVAEHCRRGDRVM
jgi:ABC-type uncharacterized transport system substrate-binding protein